MIFTQAVDSLSLKLSMNFIHSTQLLLECLSSLNFQNVLFEYHYRFYFIKCFRPFFAIVEIIKNKTQNHFRKQLLIFMTRIGNALSTQKTTYPFACSEGWILFHSQIKFSDFLDHSKQPSQFAIFISYHQHHFPSPL